jgi:uncharacterized protein
MVKAEKTAIIHSVWIVRPDEIYKFFVENDILDVAFNVEEAQGTHHQSSLQSIDHYQRCKQFFSRFYDLVEHDNWKILVREFSLTAHNILHGNQTPVINTLTEPFLTVTIDLQGNFSFFSPELMQTQASEYNNFVLGNIKNTLISDVIDSPLFQKLYDDITFGVSMCQQECEYFLLCNGGAPSCKYTENRSMRSTETSYCSLHVKALIDVLLEKLEYTAKSIKPISLGQEIISNPALANQYF